VSAIPIAYPFVEVQVIPPPAPIAQRAPGVIAIVGNTPAGAAGGIAAINTPVEIDTLDDAVSNFAALNTDGTVAATTLYNSIVLAFLQNPRPSKIYGVRVAASDYAAALASLEGVTDVTFVGLANETTVGDPTASPPTGLQALKAHVEDMSAQGLNRIGVAMIDPTTTKSATYVTDVVNTVTTPHTLVSDTSRMIMIAARGADGDMSTAAMAAIAGLAPQTSVVLKPIVGVDIPHELRYSPSEIIGLSNANIIPIIHPALVTGDGLNFGEGRLFTSNAALLFIDLVRVIDDVNFQLQAGLIGMIGDARITKPGLTLLKTQFQAILDPIVDAAEIDEYDVDIPILDILQVPESTWTAGQNADVVAARANRVLDVFVTIVYGPAVSRLQISLTVKF
jgi:hypothetical protein